jgi:hypothetical protein
VVTKLDANTYSTELSGTKFKLAHKRAGSESWSGSDRAQRKHLVQILRQMISELENSPADAPEPSAEPAPAEQPARRARRRPAPRRRHSAA